MAKSEVDRTQRVKELHRAASSAYTALNDARITVEEVLVLTDVGDSPPADADLSAYERSQVSRQKDERRQAVSVVPSRLRRVAAELRDIADNLDAAAESDE